MNWSSFEFKRFMGVTTSRPRPKCMRGCWQRKQVDKDEVYSKTSNCVTSNGTTLAKLEVHRVCEWDELPTPNSDRMYTVSIEQDALQYSPVTPNYDKIMQYIRCFPFPSPRSTPRQSPRLPKKRNHQRTQQVEAVREPEVVKEMKIERERSESCLEPNAMNNAFGRLVQVSVETMAITALPRESIDCWLKERLKKWVQLSGHEGSIVPASSHTLYKKQASNRAEGLAYEAISKDAKLNGITPRFYRQIEKNEESFIEIEDLLQQFADPANTAIMDIKIGTRTFLECEVSNTKLRSDLYDKMIAIDPEEPTDEERQRKSITKLRYMQFRERESSSSQLGFRIEAAKMPGGLLQKNFKKVRTCDDVMHTLHAFFGEDTHRVRDAVLARLKKMRNAVECSEFFGTHEVVGSSLLLMYDAQKVGVWAIDFAKSSRLDNGRKLCHRKEWIPGNNEDGYLIGVDNLIQIVEEMNPDDGHRR